MASLPTRGADRLGARGKMASGPRRRRVEPTERWEQIELLCAWPEQREYELIRPLVLLAARPTIARRRPGRHPVGRCGGGPPSSRRRAWRASSARRRPASARRYRPPSGASSWTSRQSTPASTRTRSRAYNAQAHFAHALRDDGRRSPAEMLGFASGVRHREEELRRAFFSARFVRVLDSLGYTRFRHWRIYREEALAGREAALWLATESLTVEHAGEPHSTYEVRVGGAGELRSVGRPRLFENSHGLSRPQRRLFALESLGEAGWL